MSRNSLSRSPRSAASVAAALIVASSLALLRAQTTAETRVPPRSSGTPVLVELFTSEGCSSCPPADALLARLQREQPVAAADIIGLEEHVDYWESLGWHDRFSSHQFTARQSQYAQVLHLDGNYTPQMVVDGADQFVGNDSAHALSAIARAARAPKLVMSVSTLKQPLDNDHVSAMVSIPSAAGSARADLYAALVESKASTQVTGGENGGHTLNHVSVVRLMTKIGTSDQAVNWLAFSLPVPKDASIPNLRVVVFAQRADQGAVVGAASCASRPPADR